MTTRRREAVKIAIDICDRLPRTGKIPAGDVAVLLDLLREARPYVRVVHGSTKADAWLADTADLEPEEMGDAE